MSATINIGLTESAKQVVADVAAFPARVNTALVQVMDDQNQRTVSHIQHARLSGVGPFPVEQGRLGVVSQHLRGSLKRSNARLSGATVTGSIGSSVKYAAIHEFGGVIHRTVNAGSVRLRTNLQGELLRQPGRAGAMFAKRTHKRFKEVAFAGGKKYDVVIPARAPVSRGIEDRAGEYRGALSDAIVQTWKGGAS